MTRKFSGLIDEFGFPYLYVDLINPITNKAIFEAKAIIDTGAAYSAIKQNVIDELSSDSIDTITTKHVIDGDIKTGIFPINVKFNKLFIVPEIQFRLLHLPDYPSDLIIGLDILKHCDFHYNHRNKIFEIELIPGGEVSKPNTIH